jgi:hypothetical protein
MKSFIARRAADTVNGLDLDPARGVDGSRGARVLAERYIGKIRAIARNNELQSDEVHVRGMWLCNSERDYYMSRFTLSALDEIAEMLPGRPVMVGHDYSQAPVGRFFAAERVFRDDLQRPKRDNYWVKGLFYTLARDEEGDAIARRIDGGIYQEVSVGWRCLNATCALCMNPINDHNRCPHVPGELYEEGLCDYEFSDVTTVLEGSLVFAGGQKDTSMFTPDPGSRMLGGIKKSLSLDEFLAADDLEEPVIKDLKRGFVAGVPDFQSIVSLRQLRNEVQTVLCARSRFQDADAAKRWVRAHEFRASMMDDNGNDYIRFKQWPDTEVSDGSERFKDIDAGVKVRLCKRQDPKRATSLEEVFATAE